MIEVIYKEENQEAQDGEGTFGLPKNIRQIGLIRDDYKIYMEDYVYTFLVRLARAEETSGEQKCKVAVLTGETKWQAGVTYLFVKGAVMAEKMEAAPDHIDFSDEVWKKIHEDQKKYFEDQEIIGWFYSQPQVSIEMTELLSKVHLKYFGGEKVLMLMEPQEREDAFFRYENNSMVRLGGYYLYYEKNPYMQNYMLDKNKELQSGFGERYEDKAVKDFRKMITDKNEEKKERETPSVFSYGVTACLAIAVIAVGVNFYRNYQSLQGKKDDSMMVSSVIVEEITPTVKEKASSGQKTGNTDMRSGTADTGSVREGDFEQEENLENGSDMSANEEDKIEQASAANEGSGKAEAEMTANESADKTEQVPAVNDSLDKTEQVTAGEEDAQAQIYQEESDERKAQKRMREAVQKENEAAASSSVHESYVIQPGDTLFQISMDRYGSVAAIAQICALNGMTADEIIYPGEVIVLP